MNLIIAMNQFHSFLLPCRRAAASVLLCAAAAVPLDSALSQELTDAEKKVILDELAKIEEKLNDSKSANNLRALKRFKEASASPSESLSFYLECVKDSDFDSKGKKESEWREWRDAQADFKDSNYAGALQYQLRYLVLTVQAGLLEKDDIQGKGTLLSQTVDYLTALVGNYRDLSNHKDVLSAGVLGSAFAESMRLQDTLTKAEGWSDSPLDIDGIYELTIFPYYRSQKNGASLQNAWDQRIKQLTTVVGTAEPVRITNRAARGAGPGGRQGAGSGGAQVGTADRDEARDQRKENASEAAVRLAEFKEERLPALQWEMYRDAFLFGDNKSAAVRKLGGHIRSNLGHGSASSWIEEMKTLAKGEYKIEDYFGTEDKSKAKGKDLKD